MVLAAVSMIIKKNKYNKKEINYFIITIEGLIIGLVTGLIGAGGGF